MAVTPRHRRPLGGVDRARLGAEILVAYVRVRWLLRSTDAISTVNRLRARRRRRPGAPEPATDLILGRRLGHAVEKVLRPLPTDVRCLSQSLTLLTVMERRGLRPTLVIAVRARPFAAHAWIELDGQPLLAPADPDHERLTEL
jgi:Transglutaminase-like superfamily